MALAALFDHAVRWEREIRGKAAGERTFALIALGVGFLGAGIIVRGAGCRDEREGALRSSAWRGP